MKKVGNIIRYLLLIAIDVVIMLIFHSYLNFILLIGLILFPIYSVFSAYQVKRSFQLKIMAPLEPMEKGKEFYIRFVFHNPTWFPLINATMKLEVENAFYAKRGAHFMNFPVRAKKDTEVVYPIVMDYCGRFYVSVKQIRFADLLGIWEWDVKLNEQAECLVLPFGEERQQEAGQIYINGVSEAMESKEKGYDFSEVNGIREYIPGDKLQNIHWKLSVKRDTLMVKERVSVSAQQLNVLVELANDAEMRLDCVLDLADSVTKAFVAQNLPFTVYYYSTNLGDLQECYIGNEIERLQWLEMILYDKSYQDAGQVEQLFQQKNAGGNPYLYIGYASQAAASEYVIYGEKQTVAELRGA